MNGVLDPPTKEENMSKRPEHKADHNLLVGESPKELSILTSREHDRMILQLSGTLVSTTAGILLNALSDMLSDEIKSLHLDLSGVNEASRAGVRGIIVAAKIMQTRGGDFRITGTHEDVLLVLDGMLLKSLISNNIQERPSITDEFSQTNSSCRPLYQWRSDP